MSSRIRKEPNLRGSKPCPCCRKVLLNFSGDGSLKSKICEKCCSVYEGGMCRACGLEICESCVDKYYKYTSCTQVHEEKLRNITRQSKTNCSPVIIFIIAVLALLFILIGSYVYNTISPLQNFQVSASIDNLRSYFPSQKKETWKHIFSVLDMKFPTVKSLTLLHGKNEKTTECLVNKLIMVYTNDNSIKTEDISFEKFSHEVKDYGEVLEYYRPIVEKHRILVTDLNKISGDIARIFHSLCDEGSSPIKPSLFIFTLRYNEDSKDLMPLKRATTILQEAWQDLPSNELSPLLSRVVKNVVDVIPESQIKC